MARRARLIIGAMSGTSADGVDVALVRITGRGRDISARLLSHAALRFQPALRRRIVGVRTAGACRLDELAAIGRELTLAYARAIARLGVSAGEITCIAAHGQTLFHAPPLTIQWFDPALLAAHTGCSVVSDFRRADCALGGQGAPLVPFADYILFRHRSRSRILLNIGGIANITAIPAAADFEDVIAFDTGPGNCISDALAQRHLSQPFDRAGKAAAGGVPAVEVVTRFLAHPYFARRHPKSTDGPEMIAAFDRAMGRRTLPVPDQFATACLCCVRAIAHAIGRLPTSPDEIIAAGGGMHNRAIARMLAEETALPIRTTADFGVPIEAREAMAFALLAAATLDGVPASLPSVTGARRGAVLGSITPPP